MPDPEKNPFVEGEPSATRPAKPGDTDTTRFGMEDGDNTDTPATGVDPDRQSPDHED